jgi:transcriptional regulator with XRE-family HTH domain
VQAWERNERTPRLDTLTRLALLVGRPVAWFYELVEPDDVAA